MKSKELLKKMTDIDDKFVEEATDNGKVIAMKRERWAKWAGGIAAVIAVCIIGGGLFIGGLGAGKSAPMEAEYVYQSADSADAGFMNSKSEWAMEEPEEGMSMKGGGAAYDLNSKRESVSSNLIQDSIKGLNKNNLKLVYTANMTVQTTDYSQAEESLSQLVESFGGYFENININNNGLYSYSNYKSGNYTVRIPADKYTDFINSIGDVYHVVNLSQSVDDIGEQYFEVEGRLETLKTKRDRLNELLKTAGNLSDIIQLESELSNVEYEIDNYTTRLNHYDSLVGYSTIYIYVEQVERPDTGIEADNSFGAKLARAFKRGLERTADNCIDFVLWFARNIVGVIIFIAVIILMIKFRPFTKLFRKLFKKRGE